MESTLVYSPVQCPNVLALQQFVQALCGSVNRSFVRSAVEQLPRFPIVSLNDINKLLQSWQLDTTLFKAQSSLLAKLEGPLLGHCIWPDGDRYFVVIHNVESGLIHYFSPFRGEIAEPLESFEQHWSGALLVAAADLHLLTNLIEPNDQESIAATIYQQNNVRLFDHFFTDAECDFIVQYAEQDQLFEPSQVEYTDNQSTLSESRTSYSAFLKDRTNPVFQSIYEKVAAVLDVSDQHIENLQCVRYGQGQQFKPHFDSGDTNHRLHTLLVYLNDDFEGGETFFPELNLKVQPQKGRALYFLNRDEDDTVLLYSAHAGLPVDQGVKYACNIWVRNRPVPIRS